MTKRKYQPVVSQIILNDMSNRDNTDLLNSQYYNELNLDSIKIFDGRIIFHSTVSVSYTHLTLPTKRID